jgi:hypothetical protein
MDKIFRIHVSALIFTMLIQNLYSFDMINALNITGKEAGAYIGQEYNRSFGHCWDMSAMGVWELHVVYTVRGGLSLGELSGDVTDVKAFTGVRAALFKDKWFAPIQFSLLYIYNGLLDYEAHAHTILPVISYNTKLIGISYGTNFRFTSFFGEAAEFELINSFSAFVNIINNKKWRLGIIVGNFGDFYAKNAGAYSLKSDCEIFITDNWAIINEIEFLQSGSDGLSANFYGLAWQGGAKYSW